MTPPTENAAPSKNRKPSLQLRLEAGDGAEVSLVRQGNDILFVSPLGEVLAALVQMGVSQLSVAVA